MSNKNILEKLVKIAENQQKILLKLSQTNPMEKDHLLEDLLRSAETVWLANNGLNAQIKHKISRVSDSNMYNVELTVQAAAMTGKNPIKWTEDQKLNLPGQLQSFLVQKIAQNKDLKDINVKFNIQLI